jgi:hypothetical protein
MARKTSEATARDYGNLVRVSAEFLSAPNDAARMETMSAGELADTLVPTLRKRYRDAVQTEARRLEGGGK